MKKFFLISLGLIFISLYGTSQTSSQFPTVPADAAEYPYWIEMMQDPDANFFTTQEAFNRYWENRPITRGCGWKVFKRWEYMMRFRVAPDGTKPLPDATYNA